MVLYRLFRRGKWADATVGHRTKARLTPAARV
jgi:hypothetical protein